MTIPLAPPVVDRALAKRLEDGRLWLRLGPIEIFARADGAASEVDAACRQGAAVLAPVLDALVADLAQLRAPAGSVPKLHGIAGEMQAAADGWPVFVTPMAGVAGAVAQVVLRVMRAGRDLDRIIVNNGGDMALWRAPGAERFRIAMVTDLSTRRSPGVLIPGDGIGGIATSGWAGRSHSLGIADAVTVIADTAAGADVAATLIANAVDLPGRAGILRVPAVQLAPDSDLGDRLVTRAVPRLSRPEIAEALDRAEDFALTAIAGGRIRGAALALQGVLRLVGEVPFHSHQGGIHG